MDRHLVAGTAVTTLALIGEHWAPFPQRLHRLAAYALGTGAILAGTATWLAGRNRALSVREAVTGLVIIDAAAGAVTAGCYVIDALLNQRARTKAIRHARTYRR
jgi:hypothetical protein